MKRKNSPSEKSIESTIIENISNSPNNRISFLELKKLAGPQNQDIFIEVLRDMADRGIVILGDDGIRLSLNSR